MPSLEGIEEFQQIYRLKKCLGGRIGNEKNLVLEDGKIMKLLK